MQEFPVSEIACLLGSTWCGDLGEVVTGVASLEDAGPCHLSFYTDKRYRAAALETRAAAVIVALDEADLPPDRILPVADPQAALFRALTLFDTSPPHQSGTDRTASISPGAEVADSVSVGSFVSIAEGARVSDGVTIHAGARIGRDVHIGPDTLICANVVIEESVSIGANVCIGPGTVIGSVGFGFTVVDDVPRRTPHLGTVVIEDDVEIGANCTVDRGTLGETRICRGAKLDNLIHVAHNVRIGEGVFMAAQCGIAGSSTVGDGVRMGGQSGISGHLHVVAGTDVGARSGVMKTIRDPGFVSGMPARPLEKERRAQASTLRLPDVFRRLRTLEKAIADLRSRPDRSSSEGA